MTMTRDCHNWELNPQADAKLGAGDSSHGHTMTLLKAFEGKCHAKEREREGGNDKGNYIHMTMVTFLPYSQGPEIRWLFSLW